MEMGRLAGAHEAHEARGTRHGENKARSEQAEAATRLRRIFL